ncbi:DUF1289 domain-containing protein [Roseixanthobacter glucoisosaccharinicivorans]|uniref:DUF1289 domain-containing protein n=1 Tax=Roseixanthobacter glucoisosaccharinicivorans TaxID=3119923 RepID=UPI00372C42CE
MSDAKSVFPSPSTSPFPGGRSVASQAIATPCVKICQVDPVSSLCLGCGRTTQEIGAWTSMSAERRTAVMDQLPARLENLRRQRPEAFAD